MNRLPSHLVLAAFLAGCATHKGAPASVSPAPPAPSPVPAAASVAPAAPPRRPAAPPQLGDGVKWFRSSAEYRAITLETYRAATRAVEEASKGRARDTWAVSLDTDETVLDNSVFQRDLTRGTEPFSEELWARFVRTHSSVPVPGARAFLDRVKELGGRIAIVTNRWSNLCGDTEENFKLQNLPYDVILCRIDTGDKNPRFAAIEDGSAFGDGKKREVLVFLGDNILDFPGMKQSARDEPESVLEAFGRRFFVLPNPMYGSWQQVPAR